MSTPRRSSPLRSPEQRRGDPTPTPRTPDERRRLAEVFGHDSEQTSDDRPDPTETAGRDDAWWQAQRPPHHGG